VDLTNLHDHIPANWDARICEPSASAKLSSLRNGPNVKGATEMLVVGVLARFEVKPGSDPEVKEFFKQGRTIVEGQPPSTTWFAFRIDQTTYGAFAAFASEEDRAALISTGGPVSSQTHAELFTGPPTFEMVDLLEVRQF
jgi:hypothetical protein